jgi:hypothetical protein
VQAFPDAAVTGRIIKAFDAQFEDGVRVPGLAITLPPAVRKAHLAAGLLDPDTGLMTWAGLQALKDERARRDAIPAPTGSREAPVQLEQPADVTLGAEQTAQPTPAQAKAGNYRKRHVAWNGLDITIETEAGGERTGISADGTPWSTTLQHPYGYFKGTEGRDGDQVDLYIGPHPESQRVFVFDQIDPDNQKFDEHKLVIGANDEAEAVAIYDQGFSDGSAMHRRGAITEMSVPELKAWLDSGNTKKPLAYTKQPAPRTTKRGALSLFEFLARDGGIREEAGELKAMGLDRHLVPGFGRLVRSTGKRLDNAREAAAEAGYLDMSSTVPDFLDLLSQEERGQKIYSWADRQKAAEREHAASTRADNERLDATIDDATTLAKEHGVNLSAEELREAAVNSLVNGTDLIDEMVAIGERYIDAKIDEATSYENTESPDAQVATGTGEGRAGGAPASEHAAGPAAGVAAEPPQGGQHVGGAQQPGNREGQAAAEPAAQGAKLAEGKFDRKDMARRARARGQPAHQGHAPPARRQPEPAHAVKMLGDVLDGLPTQRVRSEEQVRFQQFSTPPNYARRRPTRRTCAKATRCSSRRPAPARSSRPRLKSGREDHRQRVVRAPRRAAARARRQGRRASSPRTPSSSTTSCPTREADRRGDEPAVLADRRPHGRQEGPDRRAKHIEQALEPPRAGRAPGRDRRPRHDAGRAGASAPGGKIGAENAIRANDRRRGQGLREVRNHFRDAVICHRQGGARRRTPVTAKRRRSTT